MADYVVLHPEHGCLAGRLFHVALWVQQDGDEPMIFHDRRSAGDEIDEMGIHDDGAMIVRLNGRFAFPEMEAMRAHVLSKYAVQA